MRPQFEDEKGAEDKLVTCSQESGGENDDDAIGAPISSSHESTPCNHALETGKDAVCSNLSGSAPESGGNEI